MELKDVWQQKRKLEVKAKEYRKNARKLKSEADRLSALGMNRSTSRNLQSLCLAQARMRRSEAECLDAESSKMLAEGHLLWLMEVTSRYPDVKIEWRIRDSSGSDCYLSTGEVFLCDEPLLEVSPPIVDQSTMRETSSIH